MDSKPGGGGGIQFRIPTNNFASAAPPAPVSTAAATTSYMGECCDSHPLGRSTPFAALIG
eukprot:7335893-Pyramimonas_sp.AAC.1